MEAASLSEQDRLVLDLVYQYSIELDDEDRLFHSGCITVMAEAMRWLGRRGLVELVEDGPGRHVVVRFPEWFLTEAAFWSYGSSSNA